MTTNLEDMRRAANAILQAVDAEEASRALDLIDVQPDPVPSFVINWADGLGTTPVDLPPSSETNEGRVQRLCHLSLSMGIRVPYEGGAEQSPETARVRYVLPLPVTPAETQMPDEMRSHVLPSTAYELMEYLDRWMHTLWHGRPAGPFGRPADQTVLGNSQAMPAGQGLATFRVSLHDLIQGYPYAEVHLWVSFVLGIWRRSHVLLTRPTPRLWELVQAAGAQHSVVGSESMPDGIYF